MTLCYLKLALDPDFGQKCPKTPKIMHRWSPSPAKSTKIRLQMPTNRKKNVLAKKLEANNQKLGAQIRNQRGYVFWVWGLGFRVS